MALEQEQITLQEQFETVINSEDKVLIRDFLDDQNISDVAFLIDEFPDHESDIIANMSVHRAASVFKIIEFSAQKRIIKNLPPHIVAVLLNELPPDDRTDFLGRFQKQSGAGSKGRTVGYGGEDFPGGRRPR